MIRDAVQPAPTPAQRLWRVVSLVRYRFFLYAGLLPYLLGAAWAYAVEGQFDGPMFWSGLGGVVLAVVGVEAFNEYFDARMGTDRVFNPVDLPPISVAVFWIGVAAFAAALATGVYLTSRGGWPILAFALLGGWGSARAFGSRPRTFPQESTGMRIGPRNCYPPRIALKRCAAASVC